MPAIAQSAAGVCGACLAAPPAFDAASARVDYAFPWDRTLAAFKFHGALELAAMLAGGIVDSFGDGVDLAAAGAAPADRPDLVMPVPLAPRRLRERGANQAWEIARRVARRMRIAADPTLVLRIRETAHQLELPPAERGANVRGAFAVEPLRRDAVRGRRVAVVDDVMTTGSTIGEIAAVLKHAGAARVEAWVFARTPSPRED